MRVNSDSVSSTPPSSSKLRRSKRLPLSPSNLASEVVNKGSNPNLVEPSSSLFSSSSTSKLLTTTQATTPSSKKKGTKKGSNRKLTFEELEALTLDEVGKELDNHNHLVKDEVSYVGVCDKGLGLPYFTNGIVVETSYMYGETSFKNI